MIEIPVHNQSGKQIDAIAVDEQLLGGELRPALLKQAYVRYHANRRLGNAKTKRRGENAYSTRKLYRQKGTGNARRGSAGTNLMRGGGHGFAKSARSWRQDMPVKMRRLANRNAILAKIVDDEIKIIDNFSFKKPSTRQFSALLQTLNIDRSCLVALRDTTSHEAQSASNLENVNLTQIDRLNVFDVLNHRYLLADRSTFKAYLERISKQSGAVQPEVE